MPHQFKIFGLSVAAALAVTAVIASSASATAFSFKAASVPVEVTGRQHGGSVVFNLDAGTVSCSEAIVQGQRTVSPATSATVTPSYSGCTAFGFANVPIEANACTYTVTPVTKEGGNYEGSFDIACGINPLVIPAPGCTITIGSQTGLKKVTSTNVGVAETREETLDLALTGIVYEEHNKGLFPSCAANTVKKSNGTYNGSTLLTGERPSIKTHTGIWVE